MGMIDVEGLNFQYDGCRILHDISFSIAPGSITALVGPNGAGKTTLMRCMAALEIPESGRVAVDGVEVGDDPRKVHRTMGYLSDSFGLYKKLTLRRALTYMAWGHNVPRDMVAERVEETARRTGITEYLNDRPQALSRGYRQRVGVAMTLVHRPHILLLDEPASGLDPESRVELSQLILELRGQGMTILVSSHILAELEDYCTDMLVIREGRIHDHLNLRDYETHMVQRLTIRLSAAAQGYVPVVAGMDVITDVRLSDCGQEIHGQVSGDEAVQATVLAALMAKGIPVCGFHVQKATLQKAYMDIAVRNRKEGTV